MKKTLCMLLCFGLIFTEANAKTLLVPRNDGTLSLVCDENDTRFVTVSVINENYDSAALAPSENMKNVLIKTLQPNSQGKFVFETDLSQTFERGRYVVRTYVDGLSCENIYAAGTVSNAELKKINSAQTAAQMKAAIDGIDGFEGAAANYTDKAFAYIIAAKPQAGYNSHDFISAYMMGEAVERLNRGDILFDDMLTYYSAYTDVDCDEYAKLTDKQKAAANDIAKNISYTKRFSGYYNEIITLAQIKGAESFEDLQNKYLAYAAADGISLADYNSLGDYAKDNVFISMYSSIGGAHSKSEINALFAACVAAAKSGGSSGGSSTGGGGGGSSAGGTTYLPPSYDENASLPFSDMQSHWSIDYVSALKANGAANGYEDGTYRPDNTVTRAEFVKLITKICGTEKSSEKIFDDVTADKWYYSDINGAYRNGIIGGVSENLFEPDANISRQDAAVIINRIKGGSAKDNIGFDDGDRIADYAKNAVSALAAEKIIIGYEDNSFRPNEFVTRAECAAMLVKAFYPNVLQK